MLPLLEGQAFLDWELLSPEKELAIKLGFCFVLISEKKNLMSFPRETGLVAISTGSRAECQECGGPAREDFPHSGLPERGPPDGSGTGVTQTLTPPRGCREEADKEVCIQPVS